MSFKVYRGHMFATESVKAVSPTFQQNLMLVVGGSSSDVAWDFGNPTGTFWTAALADGTYGAVAAKCLAALTSFDKDSAFAIAPGGNETLYRCRVETASDAGNYQITSWTGRIPNIQFSAGTGPTSTNVIFSWGMTPGFQAVVGDILP
jgi:hypothetical protein